MSTLNNTITTTENTEVVNKVILTGFLGKDPTLDTVGSNFKVSKFSLATNNDHKNSKGEITKETLWHNIVLWGKMAAEASEKLKKGNRVTVEGKLSYRMFTDKSGQKRQYTDIIVHDFKLHAKKEAA